MDKPILQTQVDELWALVGEHSATGEQRREALRDLVELREDEPTAPLPTGYAYDALMFQHQLDALQTGLPVGDAVVRQEAKEPEKTYRQVDLGALGGSEYAVRFSEDGDDVYARLIEEDEGEWVYIPPEDVPLPIVGRLQKEAGESEFVTTDRVTLDGSLAAKDEEPDANDTETNVTPDGNDAAPDEDPGAHDEAEKDADDRASGVTH